jgi:G3E family GTPase
LVTERELDLLIDKICELNEDTPRINYSRQLNLDLVFGLDTKLFLDQNFQSLPFHEGHSHGKANHMENEVDLITIELAYSNQLPSIGTTGIPYSKLVDFLTGLPKENIYRVKGLVRLAQEGELEQNQVQVVNHAFGRVSFTTVTKPEILDAFKAQSVLITVMGVSLSLFMSRFSQFFGKMAKLSLHEASRNH